MLRHLAIALPLVACGPTAPPAAPASSQAAHIDRIAAALLPRVQVKGEPGDSVSLDKRMHEMKIPAVSIAVFENHKLLWAQAFGVTDRETRKPADADTLFLAGSISKSVNALGVLDAVHDGLLSLDKPINEQLTSWKLPDNELTQATPVTLRMLLSHTGGTTVHGFPGYVAGAPLPTVPQILDGKPPANTAPIRVDLAPGTKFRYSGGGITIAQLALAEGVKRPYQEVLANRVLVPLGMTNSSYEQVLSPARLPHAATGHDPEGRPIPGKRNVYPEMAAAGLWTTPTDLARFFAEVGLARSGTSKLIRKEIALEMTTKVAEVEGTDSVGLGVFLSDRNGAPMFGHNGADAGFQALAVASLDGGYGVVVMANSENGLQLFDSVVRTVFAEYGWPGADPMIERFPMDAAQLQKFVGNYVGLGLPQEITVEGGRLFSRIPFGKTVELVPVSSTAVVQRVAGTKLEVDASGTLTLLGQPQRRLVAGTRHPLFVLEGGKLDDAAALWRKQAAADPKAAFADEVAINLFGYQMMIDGNVEGAVKVFHLISAVFPASSNAHDSYAEALMRANDKPTAIAEYEASIKTLDADPHIPAAEKPERKAHAEEQLAILKKR
jgi:CubicO group peptidase (beta-lactamase class C family)